MRFTVLTPTYNRSHTLSRVYQSLCAQTFRDFEWLIIDDGSTDGTRQLVASWRSFFPIRYSWKPNGGKHTAVNLGVQQAAGDFILIVDSDDRCLPYTLERFEFQWRQLPEPDRFACIAGLCYQEDGSGIVGREFPRDYVDTLKLRDALALGEGDRCGIVRTDVFRKFPYPVFENERFILEGVVWNRMQRKYAIRFFNEPVKIAGYAPDGLSHSGDQRFSSPKGAVIYHLELALSDVPVKVRAKSAINALRFLLVAVAKGLHFIE